MTCSSTVQCENTPLGIAIAQRPTDEVVAIQTKPIGGRIHYEKFDESRAGRLLNR